MKTYIPLLFISLQLILFYGCNKDDGDISPSYADNNWYVITDKPDSPLDHLIYTIYKDSEMPIFYKDTIGQENRGTDAFGQPYIYYEVLDLSYSIVSHVRQEYTLSNNREDIRSVVELLRDSVIPHLSKKMRPKCFLIVEELTSRETELSVYVHKSVLTTAIGWASQVSKMSGAERREMAAQIVGTEIAPFLKTTYYDQIRKFYDVSNSFVPDDRTIYYVIVRENSTAVVPYATWEMYGFLNPVANSVVTTPGLQSYRTPLEDQDLIDFIGQVIFTRESDFRQKYADYDAIIKKYEIIKKLIGEIGQMH